MDLDPREIVFHDPFFPLMRCHTCKKKYLGSCPTCSKLGALRDGNVPCSTADRARLTLPKNLLEIRPSNIQGMGVYAIRSLPEGVRFGPYEGDLVKFPQEEEGMTGWLFRDGKIVDTADETKSNWLRYVNCSRNSTEQNLIAIQSKGELYYKTCRDVKPQEELLVCFGEQYLKDLGIDIEEYYQPQKVSQTEEVYYCDYCLFGFTLEEYKDKHVKRCKENPVMKKYRTLQYFTCQYCKYTVTSQEFLIHHEKWCKERIDVATAVGKEVSMSKNNDRIFICYHCNYIGTQRDLLVNHIRFKHPRASATKYTCDQCEYTTVCKPHLRQHKRTHDKISKYICPVCRTGFNQKQLLTNHMNKHLGKPGKHKCHACSYNCHNIGNLKRHINMKHTRATIYKCEYCSYTSTQESNVKKHTVYKHTNIRPYKCTYCTYTCVQNCDLKKHIRKKHEPSTSC